MKYYINYSAFKDYRFVYDDELGVVCYSLEDEKELPRLSDTDADYFKLRLLGRFEEDTTNANFYRLLCRYNLHLKDGRIIKCKWGLFLSVTKSLSLACTYNMGKNCYIDDFNESKDFDKYGFYDLHNIDSSDLCTLLYIEIPLKMGLYLVNLADTRNKGIIHKFEDLLCMNLSRLFYMLKVSGVGDIEFG